MSKATKRKYVRREAVEDEVKPTEDQMIVKVTCGRGNNLHEVETCEGSKFLVSMPTKFRKSVWIKRGDFVVVEPIAEGVKVKAEIVHILYSMQIKSLKEQDMWPTGFSETHSTRAPAPAPPPGDPLITQQVGGERESSSEEEEDDSDLFKNTNHPPPLEILETSSSEEDSDL